MQSDLGDAVRRLDDGEVAAVSGGVFLPVQPPLGGPVKRPVLPPPTPLDLTGFDPITHG